MAVQFFGNGKTWENVRKWSGREIAKILRVQMNPSMTSLKIGRIDQENWEERKLIADRRTSRAGSW